eukprot:scaffold544_cov117-Isochrysis_galbana.AAC.36
MARLRCNLPLELNAAGVPGSLPLSLGSAQQSYVCIGAACAAITCMPAVGQLHNEECDGAAYRRMSRAACSCSSALRNLRSTALSRMRLNIRATGSARRMIQRRSGLCRTRLVSMPCAVRSVSAPSITLYDGTSARAMPSRQSALMTSVA